MESNIHMGRRGDLTVAGHAWAVVHLPKRPRGSLLGGKAEKAL